jgi:hypothetical protein
MSKIDKLIEVLSYLIDPWVAYAGSCISEKSDTVKSAEFKATWEVPEEPNQKRNQIIYTFIAVCYFDPSDNTYKIFQPVLTWGKMELGGGDYWSLILFAYSSDSGSYSYYGPTEKKYISVSDTIYGSIKIEPTEREGRNKIIIEASVNKEESIRLSVDVESLQHLYFFSTLEVYNLADIMQYPNSDQIIFKNISVKLNDSDFVPDWFIGGNSKFGEVMEIIDHSNVRLLFK